jgi:hypothetical protein
MHRARAARPCGFDSLPSEFRNFSGKYHASRARRGRAGLTVYPPWIQIHVYIYIYISRHPGIKRVLSPGERTLFWVLSFCKKYKEEKLFISRFSNKIKFDISFRVLNLVVILVIGDFKFSHVCQNDIMKDNFLCVKKIVRRAVWVHLLAENKTK